MIRGEICEGMMESQSWPRLKRRVRYIVNRFWLWSALVSQDIFNGGHLDPARTLRWGVGEFRFENQRLRAFISLVPEYQCGKAQEVRGIFSLRHFGETVLTLVNWAPSLLLLLELRAQWRACASQILSTDLSGYASAQHWEGRFFRSVYIQSRRFAPPNFGAFKLTFSMLFEKPHSIFAISKSPGRTFLG
jgi:hypothetical protein